jgi:hypothetical protein
MDKKATFTNEELSKKFKNNFDLVNYAISLADNMIQTGRETRVKCDTQNRAMLILEEIQQGKDQFDEILDVRAGEINFEDKAPPAEYMSEEKLEKRRYKTAAVAVSDEEE